MALQLPRRRFTATEYHQMARAGILTEDDRVELLEGEIIEMPPIGPGHAHTVDETAEWFFERLRDVARISVQNPVRLDEHNEPQPDIMLLRRRPQGYRTRLPGPRDVLLLVEVAETSVDRDRRAKLPLYARAGIPEVWLLDLRRRTLTVYRDPSADGYRTAQTLRSGDTVAPFAFPDRQFAVAELLG